ncbi:TIGR03790 family protein [Desulfuromusa kysingii]|uniref:TIGR03790 family protein n=1 Tax=Desulfuromusa kysingii TaxID=37625 RepID=A0A1H3ZIQ8_9BACT|nr:TIGR03790 family protein [Desulfuromusa kysingii]SEA23613.1 TIGR03790 family protein [Desulfuromusa kysingii]
MKSALIILFFFLCLGRPEAVQALQPEEILLIVNQNVPASIELARYYSQKRQIPTANLLVVHLPDQEECSREEYQHNLLVPLRKFLAHQQGAKIRTLLLFYGIPLRVSAPELTSQQWRERQDLQQPQTQLDSQRQKQGAAVDSEIALSLNRSYPLEGWLPNPFFVGFQKQRDQLPFKKDQVLFVSRLDAPTPEMVRRIIDDSLEVEKQGLSGHAYFDARWPFPDKKNLQGYARYDASIHNAAQVSRELSSLPVHLNQEEALLQAGEASQAALYCGWYSLGKYVDAFDWQPGAVGYHIASSECTTLKKPGSQVWCKRMIEDGVAATIGPVAEPYVQGFPPPELFFGFLLDGYYTLAESYFLSLPYLSWQMILIGDPLYRPFRNSAVEK